MQSWMDGEKHSKYVYILQYVFLYAHIIKSVFAHKSYSTTIEYLRMFEVWADFFLIYLRPP